MTELYKLIFDLALYYLLSGYYCTLIFHVKPSPAAFFLLIGAVILDVLLRRGKRRGRTVRRLPLLLPVLSLCFRPALIQLVQMLPAWGYLCWSIGSDRIDVDYVEFHDHFFFGTKLLLLLLPGFAFWAGVGNALGAVLPYMILMLMDGVCLLRMLREKQQQGLLQGIYIGIFLLLCAGLTVGHAPQLVMKGLAAVYRTVLVPVIFALAMFVGAVGYVLFALLKWLVDRRNGATESPQIELGEIAKDIGLEEQYERYLIDLSWLRPVAITAAVLFTALILFLIFRRLTGGRKSDKSPQTVREQTERTAPGGRKKRINGWIRPQNPRLAVRFYYARFLAESRKRGQQPSPGMTSVELAEYCAQVFPGVDPAPLLQLYAPARYSRREAVTAADAERAAAVWKKLKRTKFEKEQ